jgi:hypothetical protein
LLDFKKLIFNCGDDIDQRIPDRNYVVSHPAVTG